MSALDKTSREAPKVSRKEDRRVHDTGNPHGSERRDPTKDRRVENNRLFVTFKIGPELLGIDVSEVQEVLVKRPISNIPLSPDEIAGFINLRGQIVTALNVRNRLGLPSLSNDAEWMNVVVKNEKELYSLIVDEVGEVTSVKKDLLKPSPATLDERWKAVSDGVFQLEKKILIVLNVSKLLKE